MVYVFGCLIGLFVIDWLLRTAVRNCRLTGCIDKDALAKMTMDDHHQF